jgi:hypothetical protein
LFLFGGKSFADGGEYFKPDELTKEEKVFTVKMEK